MSSETRETGGRALRQAQGRRDERRKGRKAWSIGQRESGQRSEVRDQRTKGSGQQAVSLFGRSVAMSCLDDLNDFYGFYAFNDLPFTAYRAKRPEPVEGLTADYRI